MTDAPIYHPPGIYFGLDAQAYHADPAFGSSSIKKMAQDIHEFQFDRLYGEEKDTDAMTFGSALHARLLEGRAALEKAFCVEFDREANKDALDTMADLKKWLDQHGQEGLSARKKDDLIKLVQQIDPDQKIYEVEKRKWEAANVGRIALKPKRWAQVEVAARWVQRDPLLSAVMEDGTFIQGAPEVSIFYEDRGVRLKARFDRLLRHAIVDVKSFSPIFPGPIEDTAIKTIDRMRYDVQAADYLRAWRFAKEHLFPAGLVFGPEPHPGFLAECFARPEPKWIWIMVKATGAPQPLVIDFQAKFAMQAATVRVERAIQSYVELRELFGDESEWPPMRPALTIEDSTLPAFFGKN